MKITAERILGAVVNGAIGDLQKAANEIATKTEHASPSNPVMIGHWKVTGPRYGYDNDHIGLAILTAFVLEEVDALRQEVKKLRKRLEREAADGK
jgi:HAMP domain-containing protein